MATLFCCRAFRNVRTYRLASKDPAFTFQRLFILEKCPKCGHKLMQWRGEEPDGTLSEFVDIDKGAFAQWERRTKTEQACPEAQLVSEYSRQIARDAAAQIQYQTKLCEAHRWYKGQRIDLQVLTT